MIKSMIARLALSAGALLAPLTYAADCDDVFPNAAQNSGNGGKLEIKDGPPAVLLNTGNREIYSRDLVTHNAACDFQACIDLNTTAASGDFNNFPNGSNVDESDSPLAPGSYNKLDLGDNQTLVLSPGEYRFKDSATIGEGAQIVISGPGTVRFYVKKSIDIKKNSQINALAGDRRLFIYSRDDIVIDEGVLVNAVIYSRKKIDIKKNAVITGSATAREDLIMDSGSRITFDETAITNTDFDDFCEASLPATLVAEWRMDESAWAGSPNEVVDNSGNNLNGQAYNGLDTNDSNPARSGNPGTCRYGDFNGTSHRFQVADDNLLDMDQSFSITAWIRPIDLYSFLNFFDDTIISKGDSSYNYRLVANTSGRLELSWNGGNLTSSATLSEDVWVHVAATYKDGEQVLYLNGSVDNSSSDSDTLSTNSSVLTVGTKNTSSSVFSNDAFEGQIDELRVYSGALSAAEVSAIYLETHPCAATGVDHYAISFDGGSSFSDGTGITCEASSVTIIGHDASDNPTAPGTGTTINLSTSTGVGYWSNPDVGSVVDSGGGNATYTFDTNDTVTLQFNHTTVAINPSPVNIDVDGGSEGSGEDPDIQFFDSGFRFVDGSDNRIGLGEANEFHQESGTTSGSFFLQAIRTDTDTGDCAGVFANGADVAMRLGAECNNPSTCAGEQLSVTNNANTTALATIDDNGGTGASAYSNVTLRFGTDSKAALTMNYPDAGAVSLHAQYDILNDDSTDSGVDMLGSSSAVVFKPSDFVITLVESNDATPIANPGTIGSGSGFLPAGTAFRMLVEARNASGNRTPNFGNENNPPGAEGILINIDSLVYPAGGNSGSLTSASSFTVTSTPGEFETTTISWDQVGTFTAYGSIADSDYLGAGDVTGTTSGNIGRFYPAAIVLISDSTDNSCSSGNFSYFSDQGIDISYELEARNLQGSVVDNYDNLELTYNTGTINYAAEHNDDGEDLSVRVIDVDAVVWDDGVADFSDTSVTFARKIDAISGDTLIDGPYAQLQLGINISDIDGVDLGSLDMHPDEADDPNNCVLATDCTFREIGGTLDARFGRLVTRSTHGPESASLPVPFQTEYWQGAQYLLNTDDSCTSIPRTAIEFDSEGIDVNLDASVGSGTTTGSFTTITATDVFMVNGEAGLIFSAPSTTGNFPLDVDLNLLPWLRSDWNQNVDQDDDTAVPSANISFGNYRGHDRIIYWQEQFR
ncbi:hypothetical protein R50073_31460 [Maricurvus nonylphenolicus]|uniref:DUF6701 domain-containing protein n=1 Tax=Maricurvus nonylphenolicus TaxID=1008307 RepID=UPI0036F2B8D5